MRIYLPATLARLAAGLDAGQFDPDVAYAVTPALREWYIEGDIEELEYAAAAAAARASLHLLADDGVAKGCVASRRLDCAIERVVQDSGRVVGGDRVRAEVARTPVLSLEGLDQVLCADDLFRVGGRYRGIDAWSVRSRVANAGGVERDPVSAQERCRGADFEHGRHLVAHRAAVI